MISRRVSLGFYLLLFAACGKFADRQSDLLPSIRLNADSTALLLEHLPAEFVAEMVQQKVDTLVFQKCLTLYPEATDPDLQDFQKPISGHYLLTGTTLQFMPAEAFQKGQYYMAQSQIQDLSMDPIGLFTKKGRQLVHKPIEYKFLY